MPPDSHDPHDVFHAACREMEQAAASSGGEADHGPAERRLREIVAMGTPRPSADFNTRLLCKWRDPLHEVPASGGIALGGTIGNAWRSVRWFFGEVLRDHRTVVALSLAAIVVLISVRALVEPRADRHVTMAPTPETAMSPSPAIESVRTPETAMSPFESDVTQGDAPGRATGSVRTAGVLERVLVDWHVSPKSDLETGRFVTWPNDARGTVRVEIPGLAAEDLAQLHITLYVDEPGKNLGMIFGNMKPGVTVAAAQRWAGARVRIGAFEYTGGEAALWKKYPSGLHVRLIATGEN